MLIKSFGRHFLLRALIIAAIQVGFIVAKLTGLITWHWLWVFAPFLFTGTVLAIYLCFAVFIALITE